MTDNQLPDGTAVGDAYAFAVRDADSYWYIPLRPRLAGPPALLVSDEGARIQLQAQWSTADEELRALRDRLADQRPELALGALRLDPAAVAIGEVQLLIGDGAPSPTYLPLESKPHSGFPPYNAIFSITLDADEKERAVAAFNGRKGFLAIRYDVTFNVPVAATTTISGDARDLVKALARLNELREPKQERRPSHLSSWWPRESKSEEVQPEETPTLPEVTLDACREQVLKALDADELTIIRARVGATPDELRAATDDQAINLAVRQLRDMVMAARSARQLQDHALIEATARNQAQLGYALTQTADLAPSLAGRGAGYIQVSPVPIAPPARPCPQQQTSPTEGTTFESPVASPGLDTDQGQAPAQANNDAPATTVAAGAIRFALPAGAALPIREVVLSAGGQALTVRAFGQADPPTLQLAVAPDQPLQVQTTYTATQPYESQVEPLGGEWVIDPAALGLAHIVIDASRLKAESARRAQIKVQYQPSGDGKRDYATFNFGERDERWVADWFAITCAPSLAGKIIWEWRADPVRGASQRQEAVETEDTTLKL